eukprot:TRINITY_DN235_c3_g1_i1.p1 TRINITY_DN235_c3_g1~~TRINITY_DN235_c3_g1_i1.p1  ORF type:complete len:359 (-),score=108.33 TRINITY_DN235_c3_g1_i1:67-1143(-)
MIGSLFALSSRRIDKFNLIDRKSWNHKKNDRYFHKFDAMTKRKIGTHDGTFHCDEALACFLLRQTKEFKEAEITRTRDAKLLDTLDIVVDVGGVYDVEKFRFDHHQIGFTGTLDDVHQTKLSSAGLVFKHFGKEIIESILKTDEKTTSIVFEKVYKNFIEELDAIDNGINQYASDVPSKYLISSDLSSRVRKLNPQWNEEKPNVDERFKKAMELTGTEFVETVEFYGKSWLPARSIVEKAIETRHGVDPSGEIIILGQHCPWKGHLYELEEETKMSPNIKFALFADQSGSWRVQAISKSEDSFENRVDLLWKGMRNEELSEASGIPGGVFVHINGFIGGNKTKEGALEMARKSLKGKQ